MRAVVVRAPPPGPGIAAHAKATAASDGTRRHIPPGGGGRASNLLLTHYYTLIWAQPQPPPAIASLSLSPACTLMSYPIPLPLPSNLPQRKNRSIFPPEETHAYQTGVTTQQRGLLKRKRRRGAKLVFPSLDRQSAGFRPLCLSLYR